MRLYVDYSQFLEDMRNLYRKAGWSPNAVHFSLNDLEMNVLDHVVDLPTGTSIVVSEDGEICKLMGMIYEHNN